MSHSTGSGTARSDPSEDNENGFSSSTGSRSARSGQEPNGSSTSTGQGSARSGQERSGSSTVSDEIFPLHRSRGHWDLLGEGLPDSSDSESRARSLSLMGLTGSLELMISGPEGTDIQLSSSVSTMSGPERRDSDRSFVGGSSVPAGIAGPSNIVGLPRTDISSPDSSEDERDLTIVGLCETAVSDSGSESPGTSATPSFRSLFYGPPLFSQPLLGSFEESALQGRLIPVAAVFGFTAELVARGSFLPPFIQLPVAVSYLTTRQDGPDPSTYLGHVNFDGRGYLVPRAGTIQITLFNPQRTVVHIFVVQYCLEDMPPNSCTFLRQRTLRVPVTFDEIITDWDAGHASNFSKFVIHLRFRSGKTRNIYLTPDIKFLIFNRADDSASVTQRRREEAEPMYKFLTKIITPQDPKYSPKP